MSLNGKYFLNPPDSDLDLKSLFLIGVSSGTGKAVEEPGKSPDPWTPELLERAISCLNGDNGGADLRTVQLWFQNNQRGIGPKNIQLISEVFGCGDADASRSWRIALTQANARLKSERREKFSPKSGEVTENVQEFSISSLAEALRIELQLPIKERWKGLAIWNERRFQRKAALNTTALLWACTVIHGLMAYIMGVSNVTYSPAPGIDKQVGYFFAPNWTVLELVILPMFVTFSAFLIDYWKNSARFRVSGLTDEDAVSNHWELKVLSYSFTHWLILVVCVFFVFALQWSGIHLRALIAGDPGSVMMDWNIIATIKPDVISKGEAIVLSMVSFILSALHCYLLLVGLTFLVTVSSDFSECSQLKGTRANKNRTVAIRNAGVELVTAAFRCGILGVLYATCMKVQAAYLLSDATNIFSWLLNDSLFVLGKTDHHSGVLSQRAFPFFTSSLIVVVSCAVFFFCLALVHRRLSLLPEVIEVCPPPWLWMVGVTALQVIAFFATGLITGFSLVLALSLPLAVFALYRPNPSHSTNSTPGFKKRGKPARQS